jgi:hypothetical protein
MTTVFESLSRIFLPYRRQRISWGIPDHWTGSVMRRISPPQLFHRLPYWSIDLNDCIRYQCYTECDVDTGGYDEDTTASSRIVINNVPLKPSISVKLSYIYLWLYSPLLDLGCYFSFLIFYRVGRTPWLGDQPVARLPPAHRTAQTYNKRTQTSMPWVGFEATIPAFERAKTVHALDRAATVIGSHNTVTN